MQSQSCGECLYSQLLPRSKGECGECQGILTSVEWWNGLTQKWETIESEPTFLQWSHGSETTVPVPITLCPKAENRLNIFLIHCANHRIRPCVIPLPRRFKAISPSGSIFA
jgi:hypothetical protein